MNQIPKSAMFIPPTKTTTKIIHQMFPGRLIGEQQQQQNDLRVEVTN